jgi:hypothetical protein
MQKSTGIQREVLQSPEPSDLPDAGMEKRSILSQLRFDRLELAGSFGDLGTLLPIVVAMILINKLSPTIVLLAFGLFYIMTGIYYRLPIPV